MSPSKALCSASVIVATLLACSSVQAAGLFRAYLASDGLDSNPCTVTAPCRLLPAALAAVTDGGEIWMLDSANYNAALVAITKSVTILAVPGAVGSVVAISGNAIDASSAGTHVTLRNLVIVPFPGGGGVNGIRVSGAASLTVEDSVISGHATDGIVVFSQTAVRITNCIIRDNGGNGLEFQGGATAEISDSKILTNGQGGVVVFGSAASLTTSAAISDSVLSGNINGLDVFSSPTSADARASITRSTLSDNSGVGARVHVTSGATATLSLGSNMVTGNGTGLSQSTTGATLETLGDNIVRQNGTPTAGAITTVSPL
jgi:hypothetical protein